jgi:hypothetical protein
MDSRRDGSCEVCAGGVQFRPYRMEGPAGVTKLGQLRGLTAFITEDDMRRKFGSGATLLATWPSPNDFVEAGYGHLALINGGPDPAGSLAFFTSELADPLRKLTPSP